MSLNFSPDILHDSLNRTLPGADAQYEMAPDHRAGPEATFHPPADARVAAVLILIYEHVDGLYIPMMQRPPNTGPHSRQISFPGGAFENTDPDLIYTALRESAEEMGIEPERVRILGQLSRLYVPPSNYLVYPFLGWSRERPNFRPDPVEVEEVLEISLTDLLDRSNRQKEERLHKGSSIQVPYFAINGRKIWGASAMMMSELLAILENLT